MMKQNFKQPKTTSGPTVRHSVATHILRSLLLLVLMVGVNVNVWGQTSLGKAEITAAPTSTSGADMTTTRGTIAASYGVTTAEFNGFGGKEIESKMFVKLDGTGSIKIRFAKGSVVAGDILRVETIDIYQNGDQQNLGFKVTGSNGTVSLKESDNALHTLDYTLKAADIDTEDASYDYIQIDRNGNSGCGYHSVEIVRPAGNVIKWTSGDIPTGCDAWYTLGDDPTHRKESISGITTGTKVTLTATDAGNAHKIIDFWTFGKSSLYNNAANREMTDWSHAVDGVLNLQPHFCDAYTMTAVAGTGCSSVSLKGTKDANTTEINGIKQKSSARYSLTFTATSESGADFDGWYNGDSKISGENPYNYGEYSADGTTDLTLTAKFKPANVVNVTVDPVQLTPAINIYFHTHHTGCIHGTGDDWGTIANGANVGDYTSIDVSVADVPGYVFDGWYENEVKKSDVQTDFAYGGVHNGCNLVAKFVPSGSDGTVTYSSEKNEEGTVTATVSSGSVVTGGSTVTFTATPAAGKVFWRWQDYYDGEWHDIGGAPATYEKRIDGNFTIRAIFSDPKTFTAASNGSYYGTVKITKDAVDQGTSYDSAPYPQGLKFVATPKANYSFVAWYSSDTFAEDKKVSTDAEFNFSGTSGNTDIKNNGGTLYAKFVRSGDKVTPKPDCGGKYFDQSKLVAGGGVTLNVSGGKGTITTGAGGGYVSFFFEEGYDLSEINKWTVGCQDAASGNVAYVAFCKNGASITDATFYSGAADRTLEDNHKSKLTSVDEIRIGFKESTTTTIDFFYLETKPDVMYKVPTLAAPTTNDMLLFEGETLKLRITNTDGYWREHTNDNYNVTETVRIKENDYSSSYDFENLPFGDYYFTVKHGGNCKLGHYHTTNEKNDPIKVHVKVRKAINKVEVNGTERMYDVYAPAGINGEVGVVFSLHGASNDYDNGRVDFNAIADSEKETAKKFVVVYPRGLMRQLRGTERGWETYTESNTEDVEFFKAIVTELKKTYTVDDKRIYLAGFSNGGMMAYKAAHQAGDFFAAFASVGGYPVNESHLFHAGSQPTPFIHIQGEDDGVFPSSDYDVSTIIHNMVYRNGAQFNPNESGNGKTFQDGGMIDLGDKGSKDCHVAEAGGAAYFFYKIKGLGHWCSKDWTGDGVDDIAATMWTFFNKADKVKSLDKTLKFRLYDTNVFWSWAGSLGFDNVNSGTTVLSYGGRTKTTDDKTDTFNKDSNNKNLWHSLQFDGGINGKPHFLKLNVETEDVHGAEIATDYFLVKLTKTGESTPVFAKRYQAGRGAKDLYINFSALPGFNEYKLEVTKSRSGLDVKVHGMEFYSGRCEDKSTNEKPIAENPVFFFDVTTILKDGENPMKPIFQPVYGKSYDGQAKEYLPIANLDATLGGNLLALVGNTDADKKIAKDDETISTINSTLVNSWNGEGNATVDSKQLFNLYHSGKSGEDLTNKSLNACLITDGSYTINKDKGICISQLGRAEMPEYLNGTRATFPTHGVIAIKVQGTVDFTLLANSKYKTDANRRTLKVYYTNDQMSNELKELKEWWFYGDRTEVSVYPLSQLSVNVRLPQLGKDGTCTLFVTYEGNGKGQSFSHVADDDDEIWIKGFVIKRPDLKVTVGRTDELYKGQNRGTEENTKLTRFGENKPYIWSFENVGFNNTKYADLEHKKVNENDWRTYVCGGTDDSMDHLLVYSDLNSAYENDKAQFDGRIAGQEHIEFRAASNYLMKDNPDAADHGRLEFNPINSNGLKVNVTGSGWFKIKCSAPNGPVKMKVFSSTNYGISYTNLLREFIVDNENHPESATGEEEHRWGEYTVYLKGHVEREWTDPSKKMAGFWDGDKIKYSEDNAANAEEKVRMSLYVVFDQIGRIDYNDGEGGHYPQLNIHQLSWLNEEPADYVFQREEDPKLLTTWQAIRRDNKGHITTDTNYDPIIWWKACNDDDKEYVKDDVSILKENGNDTYDRLGQKVTQNLGTEEMGLKSPGGYASTSVPSDAGTYNAYWDIAAPTTTGSHTEAAYGGNTVITAESAQYEKKATNTEFDLPVSGSFVRIAAMKNTYVAAHLIAEAKNDKENGNIYVLDETGTPLGFDGNTDDAKRRGYIATMLNTTDNDGEKQTGNKTIRIDFCVNAGKEYFICAKDASIGLARLEAQDWRYKPAKATSTLALADGANNSKAISDAYTTASTTAMEKRSYYMNAKLTRKVTTGKWISLVLPFSLNEKKFEEVFGKGARCLHFTDVDIEGKMVKFTHHYYNMIVAGRPVFVLPGTNADGTNRTSQLLDNIDDVTLQTNTVNTYKNPDEKFEFFGSYDNNTMKRNDLFMNNANAIKFLTDESATYPGMRSYIKNVSGPNFYEIIGTSTSSPGQQAKFVNFCDLDEDTATGIEELITAEFDENVVVVKKSTKVYDMNGRVVAEGADINSLPAGLYIVNGKKFVVNK